MRIVLASMVVLVAVIAGCERSERAPTATSTDTLPSTLFLATAPASPVDVKAAKTSLKEGDEVVLRGVIGGRVDPIAANRAIMTILDPGVPTCDKMTPPDSCKTPWDACCEPQDVIVAGSATVRVVGADGQPLKAGLGGAGGIKPLKEVIIVGKVSGKPDDKNLVVDATGIYVKS